MEKKTEKDAGCGVNRCRNFVLKVGGRIENELGDFFYRQSFVHRQTKKRRIYRLIGDKDIPFCVGKETHANGNQKVRNGNSLIFVNLIH